MENRTSFDLNERVGAWRRRLVQSPAFTGEDLDELEVHLRESYEALLSKELSPEEAFLIAMRRLGPTDRLKVEYGKMNRLWLWYFRAVWIVLALLLVPIAISLAVLITGADSETDSFLPVLAFDLPGYLRLRWLAAGLLIATALTALLFRWTIQKPRGTPVGMPTLALRVGSACAFSSTLILCVAAVLGTFHDIWLEPALYSMDMFELVMVSIHGWIIAELITLCLLLGSVFCRRLRSSNRLSERLLES